MKVTFERVALNNLEKLIEISRTTFSNAFAKDNNPKDFKDYLNTAFSGEALMSQIKNRNATFYFVYYQKDIVGYFKVNEFEAQSDLKETNGLELERIYVLDAYQGKQIGLQMLEKVYTTAKQKGKTYIWLGVWQRNKRAIKWYQNNNFKKFGAHPYFIGDDEQTDWLMKKEL